MAQNGCRCRQESGANERNGVGQVSEKNLWILFLFLANFILLLMTTLCVPNGMSLKWLNVDALIWGIYGQLDILKIGIYFKWCPFVIVGLKRSIFGHFIRFHLFGQKKSKSFCPQFIEAQQKRQRGGNLQTRRQGLGQASGNLSSYTFLRTLN